jgi:acyl carrier protein
MSYNYIHRIIKMILFRKMRVYKDSPSYTANFYDDYGFSAWELKWLMIHVEDFFQIKLEKGLEDQISTINQLVAVVHNERTRQQIIRER